MQDWYRLMHDDYNNDNMHKDLKKRILTTRMYNMYFELLHIAVKKKRSHQNRRVRRKGEADSMHHRLQVLDDTYKCHSTKRALQRPSASGYQRY
jgi:hypothetical protein